MFQSERLSRFTWTGSSARMEPAGHWVQTAERSERRELALLLAMTAVSGDFCHREKCWDDSRKNIRLARHKEPQRTFMGKTAGWNKPDLPSVLVWSESKVTLFCKFRDAQNGLLHSSLLHNFLLLSIPESSWMCVVEVSIFQHQYSWCCDAHFSLKKKSCI